MSAKCPLASSVGCSVRKCHDVEMAGNPNEKRILRPMRSRRNGKNNAGQGRQNVRQNVHARIEAVAMSAQMSARGLRRKQRDSPMRKQRWPVGSRRKQGTANVRQNVRSVYQAVAMSALMVAHSFAVERAVPRIARRYRRSSAFARAAMSACVTGSPCTARR